MNDEKSKSYLSQLSVNTSNNINAIISDESINNITQDNKNELSPNNKNYSNQNQENLMNKNELTELINHNQDNNRHLNFSSIELNTMNNGNDSKKLNKNNKKKINKETTKKFLYNFKKILK